MTSIARAGYTSGCAALADNPERLFFYMMPACHIGILEPFVRSIMHVKSYQLGLRFMVQGLGVRV